MGRDLERRGFLLLAGGTLLAGCTSGAPTSRPSTSPSTSPSIFTAPPGSSAPTSPAGTPAPTTPEARPPALPAVTRWHPDPGDFDPKAKLEAVREVERRGSGPGRAVQVLDAQYGGLLRSSASVLVVCRAWHLAGGRVHPGGSTYDVRLVRRGSGWRVTAVHPSRPGPARRRLPADARAVLRNPRIGLPPAGRADVRSGQVHASVLDAMLRVSRRYRIDVSVVRSGHPLHVFGTDRLSDHPQGRAFDTWRIDGQPVVDGRTPRRLVTGYMEALAAAGSYNVGGPYLLGSAPQWFSDRTHHDHVHAGFLG